MDTYKENTAVIKTSTVEQLVVFVKNAIDDVGLESVNIGLHGGEPLLMKKSHFEKICKILSDGLSPYCSLKLMCQTNGTLIDDEWVNIFEKYQVHVGVSVDGPKDIHDKNRIDHNGKGSYEETVRGIRILSDAAKQGRIPSTGALCVANVDYNGAELVKHMHQELGLHNFDLLFPREGHDSNILSQQDKWIDYFKGVIDYWSTQQKGGKLYINTLNRIFGMLMSEQYAGRVDEHKAMQHNIINVSSEGQLGVDDNILSLDGTLLNKEVNIFNTSLNQFLHSELWQSLIKAVDEKPDACEGCEWYRSCRGGALFNRYKKAEGFKDKTVFCKTMDFIHTSIAQYLSDKGLTLEEMSDVLSKEPTYSARDGLNTNIVQVVDKGNEILRVHV
ncbi:radical SAM protein [Gallaecimonas kandeliae]|uniref:radical SAM protein n=1 Tax=Gallaecimonas kandeliae TaxID=3029055 RepID=UPI002646FF61|nr:radical SAM protein [Gallaecimonas kandeliae]WKE65633.1 radical SAM protein [Gallaecimonas kandeliae]